MATREERRRIAANAARFAALAASGGSSMTVCVRVRPLSNKHESKERQKKMGPLKEVVRVSKVMPAVQVQRLAKPGATLRSEKAASWSYKFDSAFGGDSRQIQIYEATTKSLIPKVLDGVNCTVFAYGATGAGKTHTMTGVQGNEDLQGIIPRALRDIFNGVDSKRIEAEAEFAECLRKKEENGKETQSGVSLSNAFEEEEDLRADEWFVSVSYLEVYNEKVYDLLSPVSGSGERKALEPREDPVQRVVKVAGLKEVPVANASDVLRLIEEGSSRRTTEGTAANAVSSRSHAVLQVYVGCRKFMGGGRTYVTKGNMSLIDLAGSERASATNNRGARLNEGANINKSLLALANCINALSEKASATTKPETKGKVSRKSRNRRSSICGPLTGSASLSSLSSQRNSSTSSRVKYRDSKLTHLLKSSLEGNCHLVMIACVNPSHACFEESHNTLKYANRAKNIKINPQKQVQAFSPTAAQKREQQMKIKAAKEKAEVLERARLRKEEKARKLKERREADAKLRAEREAERQASKVAAKEKNRQDAIRRREALEERNRSRKQAWINSSQSQDRSTSSCRNASQLDKSNFSSNEASHVEAGLSCASLNVSHVSDISQTNTNTNISLNVSFEGASVEDIIIESDPESGNDDTEENKSTDSNESTSSAGNDRQRPRRRPPQRPHENECSTSLDGSKSSSYFEKGKAETRIDQLMEMVAALQAEKAEMAKTILKLQDELAASKAEVSSKKSSKRRSTGGTKRAFGMQIQANLLKPVLSDSKESEVVGSGPEASHSTSVTSGHSTKPNSRRRRIAAGDLKKDKPRKRRRRRHSMIPRPNF